MFLVEVEFKDESIEKECLLLRRSQAIIGAGEDAHIALDDLSFLDFQILLSRDIGRKFHLDAVPIHSPQLSHYSKECKKNNENDAVLDFDSVKLKIIAIDADLTLKDDESLDKSGVRILRHSCSSASPKYPALKVEGGCPLPFCVSFSGQLPVTVGRNNTNILRIDYPEVSGAHARIGFENGKFWIEDLGSTNGTYIGQQQISGKTAFDQNTPVKIARNFYITALAGNEEEEPVEESPAINFENEPGYQIPKANYNDSISQPDIDLEERYPALISQSSIVRPARVVVKTGSTIRIGRDQSSDIWVGAPHISRMHSTVVMNDKNQVMFSDFSTNGTKYEDGILKRGDSILIKDHPRVFDFGSGVTIAVCFDENQEISFLNSKGSINAFDEDSDPGVAEDSISADRSIGYEYAGVENAAVRQRGNSPLTGFYLKIRELLEPAGKLGLVLISISVCFLLVALIGILKG